MKNSYEIRGDIVAIFFDSKSYGRKEILISLNKLDKVKSFPNTWRVIFSKGTGTFYAIGEKDHRAVILTRFILDAPKGMMVDHINHDTLDNTDKNIRLVTCSENQLNRKGATRVNKTGIRNVCFNSSMNKWAVQIRVKGSKRYVRYFNSLEEAESDAKRYRMLNIKSHDDSTI